MNIESISEHLRRVSQAYGCIVNVTDIVEGDDSSKLRRRGVAICQDENGVTLHINAQGDTLDMLKQYIIAELRGVFVIEQTSDDAALKVTQKPTDNAPALKKKTPKRAAVVAEENDNADA